MRRGRQVTRLFSLAQMVVRPQGVSVAEAARELGCTPRTTYRDLETLQAVGYPLVQEQEDGAVRWRVMEQFRRQHRLPFTHEELTALWMAREALQALDGTPFALGARSVVDKVRETLSEEVRRRLDRSAETLAVDRSGRRRYAGRGAIVDVLRRAAEERRTVALVYTSLAGRRSRRSVDPYLLWFDPAAAALYFAGFAHDRGEVRNFLVDRVRDVSLTDRRFEVPSGWDARQHLAESFAAFRGKTVAVRLAFTGRAARLVAERAWHPSQTIAARPGGVVEVAMRVPLSPGLRGWVLSWMPEVRVLEPVELGREVEEALQEGLLRGGRRRGARGVTLDVTGVGYRAVRARATEGRGSG
jgi:proteasome accessory factor B